MGNLGAGVISADAFTERRLSDGIFGQGARFPWLDILQGNKAGWGFFDHFVNAPLFTAGAEAAYGDYKAYASTGGLVAEGDATGGVLTLSSDGDDEGAAIGQRQLPFQIILGGGDFFCEARIKTSTIADTKHGFFFGLIDTATLSATVPIAAAGTLADENFVGFHRLEGDGDMIDTVYKADGITQVTVKADAITLVADTWVKLGMRFSNDDQKIYFYKDGVVLPDSKTIPSAAGTDFPNDVRMGLVFAVLNATATTPGNSSIDFWAAGQLDAGA